MFVIYNLFLFLIILISPLIVLIRIFLGKEDQIRFKEKFGFFPKKNKPNETIWILGASVGEILSIIPIVRKFEEDKDTVLGYSKYKNEFISFFQKGLLFATQFHPEKSQSNGLNFLKLFFEL